MPQASERFSVLRAVGRVWAIGAIHGEAEKLAAIHDVIAENLEFGDRIVYLGNYFGFGPSMPDVLEELIRFRSWFLAHPPLQHIDDLVFLRGSQEEMWWKLMQLQFAPDPRAILSWMETRGIPSMLAAVGFDIEEGRNKAADGTLSLTYWTNRLRETARALPGHDALMSSLKRAAYCEDGAMLFVHTGLDIEKPLARQADAFWWAEQSFSEIDRPYRGFRRIVRGYEAEPSGLREGEYTLSLDGGAGRGGELLCALLAADGSVIEALPQS